MSKLKKEQEGPIDNVLYDICEHVSDFFYKTNHTPNMITTYSGITGILACYYYYHNNLQLFVILFSISYFFDCLDGYYARKYKMTSEFGAYYDSIKDISVHLLLIYIIYIKYYDKINKYIIASFIIIGILTNMELGCQEKLLDTGIRFKKEVELFCPDNGESLTYLRYFSPATFNVYMIFIAYYIAM